MIRLREPDPLQLDRRRGLPVTGVEGEQPGLRSAGSTSLSRRSVRTGWTGPAPPAAAAGPAPTSSVPSSLRRARSAARSGPISVASVGEQLGQVQTQLQVAGRDVAAARVEQLDLAVRAMMILSAVSDRWVDPVRVQPEHRVPHVLHFRVGHRAAPLGQRRAAIGVGGQRHSVRADPQHGPQPRRADTGVFHRVGQQRPALGQPLGGQRGPPGHLVAQPDQPVQPVQQARRLLVPVEHGHVQPPAVRGGRRVLPRLRAGHRPPGASRSPAASAEPSAAAIASAGGRCEGEPAT